MVVAIDQVPRHGVYPVRMIRSVGLYLVKFIEDAVVSCGAIYRKATHGAARPRMKVYGDQTGGGCRDRSFVPQVLSNMLADCSLIVHAWNPHRQNRIEGIAADGPTRSIVVDP
jgi:hypothetical protein